MILHTERTSWGWYAAFRQPDADELTPELAWGEGKTEEEAIESARQNLENAE